MSSKGVKMRKAGIKRLLPLFSSIFIVALFFSASPGQVHADSNVNCAQQTVSVTLSPLNPTVYHVVTWLCSRGSPTGKTVQVLVHGSTYDHTYWDFPSADPQKYSYVKQITDAGYVALNIDRIGTGMSDHPAALDVTLQSNTYVLHQLIQGLRNGTIGGTSFAKVLLIGHSFGSVVVLTEAAQFADVDGVATTGIMHAVNATGAAAIFTSFYPVGSDPKFARSNLPLGYLTSLPGIRKPDFYNPDDADASIIAQDETLKQTITDSELATALAGLSPTDSLLIHVPVLVVVGEKDITVCGLLVSCANAATIVARESLFYSSHTCLEGFVLPASGHSINLHFNADQWFQAATSWANRRIGSSSANPPTQPCQ